MKILTVYNRFSSWLEKALTVFSGVLLGIATALMFSEVITRYFFHSSYEYMEEIPRYLTITATFLMAPVILKLERHINIDLLPEFLKGRQKQILTLIISCFVLIACIYMLIAGISGVAYHYNAGTVSNTELEMPIWIVNSSFLVGSALLVMYATELVIRAASRLAGGKQNNSGETK